MQLYITIDEAEDYFQTRINSQRWDNISETLKTKALITATNIINILRFKGIKADINQELEFPRIITNELNVLIDSGIIIPYNIKIACAEIAYSLLEGVDPQQEINNLASISRSYAATKVSYRENFIHEHFRAGVPSPKAWQLLKPYLASVPDLTLSRIN